MSSSSSNKSMALPAMMASVVASAVANTILRRIALVPMQHYPYFVTQLQTLLYVCFYSGMLYWRYENGQHITKEMLQIRKAPFVWIGLWDSIGDMLGNVGTSNLPGYQVPLLAKLNIVFTAVFSSLLLGKRYSWKQIGAMTVVLCGSVVTLIPTLYPTKTTTKDDSLSSTSFSDLFYAGIYVASVAPTALAFVLKEQVFREHQHLNLDIFVVNTFGSIVGLVFTLLLLPMAAIPGLGKIDLRELPQYMVHGAQCFQGYSPTDQDNCTGSPLAPLLYFAINLTYNIAFLTLIKHGGALLTFITNTVTFPLSTILFTLPWPLLGASNLNKWIVVGLLVELTGIVLYQRASSAMVQQQEKWKGHDNEISNDEEEELLSNIEGNTNRSNHRQYGTSAVKGSNISDNEAESADYLQESEPPLCYNKALRVSLTSSCCHKEDLCKCLLSNKCNCG